MVEGVDPAVERIFRGHSDSITSVSFNPNMKQVVSGSLDSTVMVWNFKPQLRAYKFVGHKVGVNMKMSFCFLTCSCHRDLYMMLPLVPMEI